MFKEILKKNIKTYVNNKEKASWFSYGKAVEYEKKRMNHNFHTSPDSKALRLLNALEPGTQLPQITCFVDFSSENKHKILYTEHIFALNAKFFITEFNKI